MDLGVQTARHRLLDRLFELHLLERVPQLLVLELVERVEIRSHCADEERGLLRNDGELASQLVQTELADVDVVDEHASLLAAADLGHSEDGLDDGGLACACAADDADFLARFDVEGEVVEDVGQSVLGVVAEGDVVEGDGSFVGPVLGWALLAFLQFLRFDRTVLYYSLQRCKLAKNKPTNSLSTDLSEFPSSYLSYSIFDVAGQPNRPLERFKDLKKRYQQYSYQPSRYVEAV